MNKVIVIGCPGSGKSYFSKKLNKITGLPLYHLDNIFWNADKTTVDKNVFNAKLSEILAEEKWIIDGNYQSTMEQRFIECDTVFFLDYPLDVCLDGISSRKGKSRSDIPWVETKIDINFLEYIKNFNSNGRQHIINLLKKYAHKHIVVFSKRTESEEYLMQINM